MPRVAVPGDVAGAMGGLGVLVGMSTKPAGRGGVLRVVWCFGFERGTPRAEAFLVSVPGPLWVLAWHTGTVLETFQALTWTAMIPAKFSSVLYAKGAGPQLQKPLTIGPLRV